MGIFLRIIACARAGAWTRVLTHIAPCALKLVTCKSQQALPGWINTPFGGIIRAPNSTAGDQ